MPILHKNINAEVDIHNPKWFPNANNGDVSWKNELGNLESTDELVLPAALDFVDASVAPPTTNAGDIYVLASGGSVEAGWGAVALDDWVRYDGTDWNSITPQKSSLCYDKNADKLYSYDGADWQQVGGDSIYTASGTVPTSVVATLTDTLRFKGGTTAVQGADTLSTSTAFEIYDNDTTPSKLWDFRNNGDIYLGKDSVHYLQGNDLTISTLSGSTTPINYEFGTAFGGYYSRWDNNGGLTIKSGTTNLAFRVLSKVDATQIMFRVGNEGGGFLSTNGARLWTISDSTTSTTKNEFDENRFSQYWSGSEYHRIQTSGGGTGVSFFRSGISGSLGYFIVGSSSRVGSEEISFQGDTLVGDTSDKVGFMGTAPIVQVTTGVAAATFTANTSGIADDTATFDGYTIGQVVKALRNYGLLA
jgi:hypothetical protein